MTDRIATSTGRRLVRLSTLLLLLLPSTALAQTGGAAERTDSASLITRLGHDTLAVERFVRTAGRIEAEVVLRSPRLSRTRYIMDLSPSGGLTRIETIELDLREGTPTENRSVVTFQGDSLRFEGTADRRVRASTIAANDVVLPFIDMVHWPFELALIRARAAGAREVAQPMLSGSRVVEFTIGTDGPAAMTVTHPTRGTMQVSVDSIGRLLSLDASATTRKLVVERGGWIAVEPFAARWLELEARGESFGALSGRARAETTGHGATIDVDYGTPLKRGREIWGALVPFGEVWRTGANQATHFSTSRDLVFGAGADTLVVPAGTYTLFSIPEREGGVLIINRQTGQTGTAYNPARDLGRVALASRPLPEVVERFTILVTMNETGGELRLQWDETELVAPFRVR